MNRATPQNAVVKAPSELRALTGVRFVAAFLVVIHHYLYSALGTAPRPVSNVAAYGYTAVGLFFLLSGFVLAYRYLGPSGEFHGSASSFWIARLARIYPAYLLAFLLSMPFVIGACLRVNPLPTAVVKLGINGLLALGLLQSWTPWSAWYWNTPAWSLSVEVFFYLSFPLLALLVGRMGKRTLLSAAGAVWVVAMLIPLIFLLSGHRAAGRPPMPVLQVLLETCPPFRLPEFFTGMLLGRYFALTSGRKSVWGTSMILVGLSGWAVLLALGSVPRAFFAAGLLMPFSSLLVLGLAYGRGWIAALLATPVLVLLGEASYSIYILQWPLAKMFGIASGARSVVEFSLFAAALIAVSILSLKQLESPVRRAILRRFRPGANKTVLPETSSFPALIPASVPASAIGELR